MPNNAALLGIVGTDGISPVYNPDSRWCWWGLHEVYRGETGTNMYVPKVKDYVMDTESYTAFVVDHLDPVTLIPTLREIRPANMSFSLSRTDVLFGTGPGTASEIYRVYIDKSVTPHVLSVDAALKVAGTQCQYAKIFRSTDVTVMGKVVSMVYDSSGNLITNNVPLELAAMDSHVNHTVKVVAPCFTTENLVDGELVTVVYYSAAGHVVHKRQLMVEVSSFIRNINASTKYISHISLDTAFLSPTLDHVINFPVNIPLNSLNMMGVVHYSDGSTLTLPVDGTKFRMFGLDQYVSTIVGQSVNLVLSYELGAGEVAYNGLSEDNRRINEPYDLVTVNPNNSYAVKLFVYPEWISELEGYGLRWWMFNMDRNVYFDVTGKVMLNSQTGPFAQKGYGYQQVKNVSVNLGEVSSIFKNFIHTQTVEVNLFRHPNESADAWTVSHEYVVGRPTYGAGLLAKLVNNFTVRLKSGAETYTEWKQRVYLSTHPILDVMNTTAPPEPTHFILQVGGVIKECTIDQWDDDIAMPAEINQYANKNLFIRFVRKIGSQELQLSMAAMVIKM
jgi:hypothetical protein